MNNMNIPWLQPPLPPPGMGAYNPEAPLAPPGMGSFSEAPLAPPGSAPYETDAGYALSEDQKKEKGNSGRFYCLFEVRISS